MMRYLLGSIIALSLLTCAVAWWQGSAWPGWIMPTALAVLALAIIWFYANIMRPWRAVENGMGLLRAQDYASRLRQVGQQDTDNVVGLFNDLMERLKRERLSLQERNQLLQQLIDSSQQGIVILDLHGEIESTNYAARQMLKQISLPSLSDGESRTLRSDSGAIYRVMRQSFIDRGAPRSYYIIEILTEEVRRAERDAYGRIIRTMAHEVNNTMGGIDSVLQLLRDTSTDASVAEAIDSCRDRAQNMTSFISAYANLVKTPAPQLVKKDLADSLRAVEPFITQYAASYGISTSFDYEEDVEVELDPMLWEQAIVNIVKNSVESILSTSRTDGHIRIANTAQGQVTITDNGAGLSPDAAEHLFTPFFTTKPQGQGIGLMLVAEVLRGHHCHFSLRSNSTDTIFTVQFP